MTFYFLIKNIHRRLCILQKKNEKFVYLFYRFGENLRIRMLKNEEKYSKLPIGNFWRINTFAVMERKKMWGKSVLVLSKTLTDMREFAKRFGTTDRCYAS